MQLATTHETSLPSTALAAAAAAMSKAWLLDKKLDNSISHESTVVRDQSTSQSPSHARTLKRREHPCACTQHTVHALRSSNQKEIESSNLHACLGFGKQILAILHLVSPNNLSVH